MSETERMSTDSVQIEHLSSNFNLSPTVNERAGEYHPMAQAPNTPRSPQTIDREAFRKRLQWVRERSGLSKTDFAESIGMPKGNYGQVESGNRMLTVDQMYTVYVVHGVPLEYLVMGRETDLPDRFRN
ncbi:MAG: helix-turn-helix transcriptional regulator [Vannielia sp.]